MLLKGISEKSLRLLEAGLMSLNEIFGSFNLIFEEQKRLKKYNDALGFFREGLANIEDEMHYPDVRDDSSIPYLINTIAINENRNELRREWPKILSLDISEVEKRYIIPIKQEFKKIKRGAF
ncbi:MAG: hypothetical protein NTV63_00110, partial [Candidatus Woesearchaeota archaeon]|nr:hypothetical protein [Candidatus Woesearchaeota archaeon]